MVKRITNFVWNSRRELFKYITVGGSGVILDIATLRFFKEVLGWHEVGSVAVNQIILLSYNFLLNKYWSFRSRGLTHIQLIKYLTLASGNYIFSVLAMYIFSTRMEFNYTLVRVGCIAVMTLWNFVIYKKWVYREGQEPRAKSQEASVL